MEYAKIKQANDEITKTDIKGKEYSPVNERILAFKKVYEDGRIIPEILEKHEDSVLMQAKIYDDEKLIAVGHAEEVKKGGVNATSMLENCETSAVGRALGMAGFGVDKGIASEQEMNKVENEKLANKKIEIYDKVYITETDAIKIVKVAINELIRKQGVILEELKKKIRNNLWTELEDLNYQQLGRLENKLRNINKISDDWHDLYAKNPKIKDVVIENVEVVYESSLYKFGKLALKQFENDELKMSEIIDGYLQSGIDLTK